MLTRCPNCATTFRVTPEQLKARHGRVRCGQCHQVFDALETLIDAAAPVEAAPAQGPETKVRAEAAAAPERFTASPDLGTEIETPDTAGPVADDVNAPASGPDEPVHDLDTDAAAVPSADGGDAAERAAMRDDTAAESGAHEPARAAEPDTPELSPFAEYHTPEPDLAPKPDPAPEPDLAPEPDPVSEPAPLEPPRRRTWPWALGSVAAILLLMAQAAIHYRTEIAVLYPQTRPALAALCEPLDCEVSLPRKPELIGIEASDLAPDPNGKLTLTATIRNRAPFAQQYPALELTLSDTGDRPLARRVLRPADYLPPQTPVAPGLGAGAELVLHLAVEAPDIPAAGYQLYLFYP